MKVLGKGTYHIRDILEGLHLTENKKSAAGRLFHIFKIGKKFEEIPRGVCGYGRKETEIIVDRNTDIEATLHFENLKIKGKGNSLVIRDCRITFDNVIFEGVSLELYNNSYISLIGCQFINIELPIKAYNNSVIEIEGTETFRNIKGKKVELHNKAFIRNAKDLMNPLKLDLLSVIKSLSIENPEGVFYFEITEPILIDKSVEIGNSRVAFVFKVKNLPTFIIAEGVKTIFRNVSIEGNITRGEKDQSVFLLNPASHLEMINCTMNCSNTIFYVHNAHLDIEKCEIKNTLKPAINSRNSSVINIANSQINSCKGFIEAEGSSHININNSKISGCSNPVINIRGNSKLALKSTDILGFKGDDFCIVISDSNCFAERINISSSKENTNGIYISNSSKAKLISCSIRDLEGCGIFIAENSFAEVNNCIISNSAKKSSSMAQVWIKASRINLINTKIEESSSGSGLSVSDRSAVYIRNSKISNNKEFGIFLDKTSALRAENLKTENNRKGIMSEIGSKLIIEENCQIKDEITEDVPLKLTPT